MATDDEIRALAKDVLIAVATSTRTRAMSISCPTCGAISHHPNDIAEGYCGRCHEFTGHAQSMFAWTMILDDGREGLMVVATSMLPPERLESLPLVTTNADVALLMKPLAAALARHCPTPGIGSIRQRIRLVRLNRGATLEELRPFEAGQEPTHG